MNPLRRFLDSPGLELCVGLILLAAGLMEIREVIMVRMPNQGPMLPHAAATVGAALILRSLPGMFLGLELADKAVSGLSPRPALSLLDRVAHSHAADLAMGVILLAAGAADLADIVASGAGLPSLAALLGLPGAGAAAGAVAFGLAPAMEALLALYHGARRLDRERPSLLLDRAARSPALQALAGLAMLAGGVAGIRAAALEVAAPGHGQAFSGALSILGLFGLLSGLPGVYLGLAALAGRRKRGS